jgi:hypothetical protein
MSLATATWEVEGRLMAAKAVSILHPAIQSGLDQEAFMPITANDFCGIVRSYHIHQIFISHSDPVHICVMFVDDEPSWYVMDMWRYNVFMDQYLGSYISILESHYIKESKVNWMKEGF